MFKSKSSSVTAYEHNRENGSPTIFHPGTSAQATFFSPWLQPSSLVQLSSLRRHDSSLAPHSAMCGENYLFSCCNSIKAKPSQDSAAALVSPYSYSLQQQLALLQRYKSSEDTKDNYTNGTDVLATELCCFNNNYCLTRDRFHQKGYKNYGYHTWFGRCGEK